MASKPSKGAELSDDIHFIQTPPTKPSQFDTGEDCGIPLTNVSLSCFAHLFATDLSKPC